MTGSIDVCTRWGCSNPATCLVTNVAKHLACPSCAEEFLEVRSSYEDRYNKLLEWSMFKTFPQKPIKYPIDISPRRTPTYDWFK